MKTFTVIITILIMILFGVALDFLIKGNLFAVMINAAYFGACLFILLMWYQGDKR